MTRRSALLSLFALPLAGAGYEVCLTRQFHEFVRVGPGDIVDGKLLEGYVAYDATDHPLEYRIHRRYALGEPRPCLIWTDNPNGLNGKLEVKDQDDKLVGWMDFDGLLDSFVPVQS